MLKKENEQLRNACVRRDVESPSMRQSNSPMQGTQPSSLGTETGNTPDTADPMLSQDSLISPEESKEL